MMFILITQQINKISQKNNVILQQNNLKFIIFITQQINMIRLIHQQNNLKFKVLNLLIHFSIFV